MDEDISLVGFYNWGGDPCQVVADDDDAEQLRGEVYRAGVGFVEVMASDIVFYGKPIGETRFKRMILDEMEYAKLRARKSGGAA